MDLLAGMTEAMSAVGRRHPDLMQDRNVQLFIDLMIAEAKKTEARSVPARAPLAPVNLDRN